MKLDLKEITKKDTHAYVYLFKPAGMYYKGSRKNSIESLSVEPKMFKEPLSTQKLRTIVVDGHDIETQPEQWEVYVYTISLYKRSLLTSF